MSFIVRRKANINLYDIPFWNYRHADILTIDFSQADAFFLSHLECLLHSNVSMPILGVIFANACSICFQKLKEKKFQRSLKRIIFI